MLRSWLRRKTTPPAGPRRRRTTLSAATRLGVEPLEDRRLMASVPFGAMPDDTGEYMIGDVGVTVVLLESDPTLAPKDNSTENWNSTTINAVKAKVAAATQWWQDTLSQAFPSMANMLHFTVDYQYADNPVRTGYEPINRKSDDFQYWMYDFLKGVGYNQTGDFSADIRAWNHDERQSLHTNWAFTIFVVNSTNDIDDSFAAGGSFSRAFSYAGGRFMVIPSDRPTSTFAHETGHMFWAKDEYLGEDYTSTRGYYNTQNFNAVHSGYTQVPSIMSSGQSLTDAFNTNTSSTYTLAMIGWQDTDGDGVFDVLDVPLTLKGSGRYNPQTGQYRFVGSSAIQTLPNLNSAGLQNDITINEVSRAEYRIDGGAWQTAVSPGGYSANLDFSFAAPSGSHQIEIRTIDAKTGVTSPVFTGTTDRPTTLLDAGINGFVYQDADTDQQFDNSETGLAGWTVQLLGLTGQPLVLRNAVEPDNFALNTNLKNVVPGVSITATGPDTDKKIYAVTNPIASLGGKVFATFDPNVLGYATEWIGASNRNLDNHIRLDFTNPVTSVSLDALGFDGNDYGRLEIYDANNVLLGRYTTKGLAAGQSETMSLSHPTADIAYAIATSHLPNGTVLFDHLEFGAITQTTTDSLGAYHLPSLPAGTYTVHVVAPNNFTSSGPAPADQVVTLGAGEASASIDFGAQGTPNIWCNSKLPEDVNNDGFVVPLDALLVINDLNINGGRKLPSPGIGPVAPPPFIDVSNDGWLSPLDALLVINKLNNSAGGEAAAGSSGGGAVGGSDPNGEDPLLVSGSSTTTLTPEPGTATSPRRVSLRDFLASTFRARESVVTASSPGATTVTPSGKTSVKPINGASVSDDLLDTIARDVIPIWSGEDETLGHGDHDHDHDEH